MLTLNAVVVDGVHDFPVVRLRFRGFVMVHLLQTAVGYGDETLRHGDVDLHAAIWFISPVILVGPPDARADALCGRDDEVLAKVVAAPSDAADPWRILRDGRNTFVKNFDLVFDASRQ